MQVNIKVDMCKNIVIYSLNHKDFNFAINQAKWRQSIRKKRPIII